ncbi:MAG: metallophosphoesterase [Oscillospiraceae bacterium]|nr:metallophosphoesterase [Oscillospiraceae bacterium]
MKILVMSDSHAGMSFMRYCVDYVKPAHVIHLGDHYDDATVLAQEYPHIRFHQVPGNCDRYRCDPWMAEVLSYPIEGVKFFMTHGHRQMVKGGTGRLLADARASGVDAVLYGHTHRAECYEEDGLWVMNPGSCGSYSGSVGVIEIQDEKISACAILTQTEIAQLP